MADGPPSIEHRCLEYCYTKLGSSNRYSPMHVYAWQMDPPQLTIAACKTITPNKFHISENAHIY